MNKYAGGAITLSNGSNKRKGDEKLWHVRTGAPQECHVRIEYFEVVVHEMLCNIKKRIQNTEFRIQNCCRAFWVTDVGSGIAAAPGVAD